MICDKEGATALTECGLVPALLNLLRVREMEKGGAGGGEASCCKRALIVSQGIHILETLLRQSSAAVTTFREIGGGGLVVARLHEEIISLRISKEEEEARMVLDESSVEGGDEMSEEARGKMKATATQGHYLRPPSPSVKVLIYALLRLLNVAFRGHGGAHMQGTLEGSQHLRAPALTETLHDLFVNANRLNGNLMDAASMLLSDLISHDPSVVSYVHSAGLAGDFLSMLARGGPLPPCSDLLTDIPAVLSSLSINTEGLTAVRNSNPFPDILKWFTNPNYVHPNTHCMQGKSIKVFFCNCTP